jgi:hypothetical protein
VVAAFVFVAIAGVFTSLHLAGRGAIPLGRWIGPCGFKQRHTTAGVAFAQGRILRAFYIQPAGAFLCCGLAIAAILSFLTALFGVYFRVLKYLTVGVKVRYVVLLLAAVIAAGWAVTLVRALVAR